MKKLLFIFAMFLMKTLVFAQESKLDIFLVDEHRIVSGTLLEDRNDTLFISLDGATLLAFAKSNLQGMDLEVSKKIKRLQRKLIRSEMKYSYSQLPGIEQIRTGEKWKGGAMLGLSAGGGVIMLFTFVEWGWRMAHAASSAEVFFALFPNMPLFAGGLVVSSVGLLWNEFDKIHKAKQLVRGRYYYVGKPELLTPESIQ